ncbi:RAD51-associated protein 1 isoform X2 [Stigmatopora nigra]
MDRPARKTKVIDYSEVREIDNDDDFACAKPPPGKKAKNAASPKTTRIENLEETALSRDLQAAISLSMLACTETNTTTPASQLAENLNPVYPHHSNCSVDSSLLGLDEISCSSPVIVKKQRQPSRDAYLFISTTESESELPADSDDEEFMVKKKPRKKVSRKQCKPVKKENGPPELKAKPKTATVVASPRIPPPMDPAASSSQPVVRMPRWNPPGQVGNSPSPSPAPSGRDGAADKSPTAQGLRLGLSRRVRVKPLHRNTSTT